MDEMTKHGRIGLAAMRAGVDRKTARKYVFGGKLPSELVEPRDWRTREDPFLEHWPEVETLLVESPGLEAKTLFELLLEKYQGRYDEGQLRTLQRRVKTVSPARGPVLDEDRGMTQTLVRAGELSPSTAAVPRGAVARSRVRSAASARLGRGELEFGPSTWGRARGSEPATSTAARG